MGYIELIPRELLEPEGFLDYGSNETFVEPHLEATTVCEESNTCKNALAPLSETEHLTISQTVADNLTHAARIAILSQHIG